MIRFAEKLHIVPLLAPAASSDSRASAYINIENAHWASFLLYAGAMTSDSTDTITITVEASTAASSNATEIQVPFQYRLSSATGGDLWGAIGSAAAATGYAITAEDDNKLLLVEVNPDAIPALTGYTDHKFLRVVCTADIVTAYSLDVVAILEPRYGKNLIPSST